MCDWESYEEQSGFERAENAACDMYISWPQGWGLDVDRANYRNWQSYQLGAVWEGALRMSNVLGWGTDGRLFQEKVLQGGRLIVDKVRTTTAGGCEGDVYACTEKDGSRITFSGIGLQGANADQWAFDQLTVIHELAHVWDKRLNPDAPPLSAGLDRTLANAPDGQRDRGGRPNAGNSVGEEDFAESVAAFVMAGTRARPPSSFYGSQREQYVACVATAPDRAERRCG